MVRRRMSGTADLSIGLEPYFDASGGTEKVKRAAQKLRARSSHLLSTVSESSSSVRESDGDERILKVEHRGLSDSLKTMVRISTERARSAASSAYIRRCACTFGTCASCGSHRRASKVWCSGCWDTTFATLSKN